MDVLLHGCLLINKQCIQALDAEHKREEKESERERNPTKL
jgi:hypothetical protein